MNIFTKIKIASRNVLKNKRRSIVTVLAIWVGFVSLSLFEGYFTYIYDIIEKQAIIAERHGHLSIAKKGFYEQDGSNPREFMISAEELEQITTLLQSNQAVTLISPRLEVNGLVSNGDVSRIFFGEGIIAEDLITLRGEEFADLPGTLLVDQPYSASFGSKLGELLGIDSGDSAVLLTSTAYGMVNAVDVKVGDLANTGTVGTNDKFILLPLELAQKLYDFDGADKISILLDTGVDMLAVREELLIELSRLGFDVEIKHWKELSDYYNQLKGLFDMMYLFITIVVSVVVIASVANTMGMAISERTREIGTLRAIGMKIRDLYSLFVWEAILIVFIGCTLGIISTYTISELINNANITYLAPDASAESDLIVTILFKNLISSTVVLTLLAAIASYFPAKRAAKKPIVEALSHV